MPLKPIKHGIKVFFLYHSVLAVMIVFDLGKEYSEDNSVSVLQIINRLIVDAGLTIGKG